MGEIFLKKLRERFKKALHSSKQAYFLNFYEHDEETEEVLERETDEYNFYFEACMAILGSKETNNMIMEAFPLHEKWTQVYWKEDAIKKALKELQECVLDGCTLGDLADELGNIARLEDEMVELIGKEWAEDFMRGEYDKLMREESGEEDEL